MPTASAWTIHPDTGFLLHPAPLEDTRQVESPLDPGVLATLEEAVRLLPDWLTAGTAREHLTALPTLDLPTLERDALEERLLERLFLLLGGFASAYLHLPGVPATLHLPANLARPLAALGRRLGRPPILSYTGCVLANWRRIDPRGPFLPDNLETLLSFTGTQDERWFFVVHAAIEAHAGRIVAALQNALQAATLAQAPAALNAVREMQRGLVEITRIFHRMPEQVDPDRYYQQVRPYLFGFEGVIFQGVPELGDAPQHLRGGSGAQSAIVPALLAGLGLRHEANELTRHLDTLQAYMPTAHRRFILRVTSMELREFARAYGPLRDAYNHVLRQLITFRRAHLYYARTYIFEKSTNPVGTGGTAYMSFLSQLIDETEAQML